MQLVHCGFFASPQVISRHPLGASRKLCLYRGAVCGEMSPAQIEEKTADFAGAARLAREAGFDAVELHAGHGYLLSQFLSPWTNRRRDRYGGSLENRLRFTAEVVRRVRAAIGPDFPVLVKFNQRDGFPGGLEMEEAVEVARGLQQAGASALIPSCGFTARTPLYMLRGNVPVREMAANQPNALMRLAGGEINESDCGLCNRCISAERGLLPRPFQPSLAAAAAARVRTHTRCRRCGRWWSRPWSACA